LSDYRPSDFKQRSHNRQLATSVDERLANQMIQLKAARGTAISVELRRAAREYLERELPKLQVEKVMA
jgi:hypothetical protein